MKPSKGPVSAALWNRFGSPESDLDQTAVHRRVCSKVIAANGSSTNLFQHLRQRHPAQGEKCGRRPAQTAAAEQVTFVGSFPMCPYDRRDLVGAAASVHVAKDSVDVYMVVYPQGEHCAARFVLPSRKCFS